MNRVRHANLFLGWVAAEKGLSENSIVSYRFDLQRFDSYLLKENLLDSAVTHTELQNFVELLYDIGFAPSSIQRSLSTLRNYYTFLAAEGHITTNPTELLESPRKKLHLPTVLRIDEIIALFEAIDLSAKGGLRDRALLETMYSCGLRVSEVLSLTKSSLIEEETFLFVRGKGNKERLIPLGSVALHWIHRYYEEERPRFLTAKSHDTLFLNQQGSPLSRMGVWKIIQKHALTAGLIAHVSPHTFRHSFATHLLEGGADLRIVQELLGHANITTTEIYTHIDRSHLMEVHHHFHPRQKTLSTTPS